MMMTAQTPNKLATICYPKKEIIIYTF